MRVVEWFYAKNNQQYGPVGPAELKQLAQTGQLGPEDLVWRPGMQDWTTAARVKGLFHSDSSAAVKDTPPANEEAATVSDSQTAARDFQAVDSTPAVFKTEAPAVEINVDSSRGFQGSAAYRRKAQPRAVEHVVDHLLSAAKRRLTQRFVDTSATIFGACGYYGLYVAMGVSVLFAVVAATEGGMRQGVILSLVAIPLLVVLQYAAHRFLEALEGLNRATSGRLDSSVVLDCFAMLSFLLGFAALIGLAILAVQTQTVGMVLSAIAAFIICQYLAVIAINPSSIYVTIGSTGGAGEEALALISCFLKMILLRMVPVAFGVGVVYGIVGLIYAIVVVLLEAPGSVSLAAAASREAFAVLCVSAVLPLATYAVFLVLHLGIDLLRGLVRLATPGDRHSRDRMTRPK